MSITWITARLYAYSTKTGPCYSAILAGFLSLLPLTHRPVPRSCLSLRRLPLFVGTATGSFLGVFSLVLYVSYFFLVRFGVRNEGPKGRGVRGRHERGKMRKERRTGKGNPTATTLSPLCVSTPENIFHPPKPNGRMPSNTTSTAPLEPLLCLKLACERPAVLLVFSCLCPLISREVSHLGSFARCWFIPVLVCAHWSCLPTGIILFVLNCLPERRSG